MENYDDCGDVDGGDDNDDDVYAYKKDVKIHPERRLLRLGLPADNLLIVLLLPPLLCDYTFTLIILSVYFYIFDFICSMLYIKCFSFTCVCGSSYMSYIDFYTCIHLLLGFNGITQIFFCCPGWLPKDKRTKRQKVKDKK